MKLFVISQWNWDGGLHRRFLWDKDNMTTYTDPSGQHRGTGVMDNYSKQMGAKLIFIF